MTAPRLLPLFALAAAVGSVHPGRVPAPATAGDPKPAAASFAKDGVAFLKQHCVSCHGPTRPKADLNLAKYADDASLLKDRKVWGRVQETVRGGEMPPPGKPQPPRPAADAFLAVVAGVFDHADRTAKPDPGRVTMRRLNKAEYNNTIRDLMGVEFEPAADFPSDDVGHGFDNIGDVLTLPPVLMERYLAAAETVTDTAITPTPPKPRNSGVATRYTEPSGPKVPLKDDWRVVSGDPAGAPVDTGPIFTRYNSNSTPSDGQYIGQTSVYVETTGTKPVTVVVLAGCEAGAKGAATEAEAATVSGAAVKALGPFLIVKSVEVKPSGPDKPTSIKAGIPADIGLNKLAVGMLKPADGEPPATLYVKYMSLHGPLDSRPRSHRILLASDESKPPAARTREVLNRFLPRCYRRPVTADEVERLAKMTDGAVAGGAKWEAGVQLAMTAALCSPKFLFRVETDSRPAGPDARPLDEYQLASRLSYFLWASMPDDELFALAASRQLSANLPAQVKRMLASPKKAESLVKNFALQWLQLQTLRTFQPDPARFPTFNEPLRAAMLEETKLFFQEIIRDDRSVLDILDADFTYLNAPLAKHYGILDTAGNPVGVNPKQKKPGGQPFRGEAFHRVSLAGTNRGGVLTQASVLAVTSNPTRTSPVKRGRWVLEQLLGAPPPPPPPDVPELEKDGKPLTAGSLRQRMEEHRKNVACASCHAKMDPLGFGLENFDAVGAFRTKDGDFPIDPSGELPGGLAFSGPAELKTILAGKKDQFVRCLAEKMMTYALGRGLEYYDKRAVDHVVANLAKNDYKFSALVAGIVTSEPFRLRRGTAE